MVQKGDLKSVSFREAPGATGTLNTTMGRVPDGMHRNIYQIRVSPVGAGQFEMLQRSSGTTVSDVRKEFFAVPVSSAPICIPTNIDIKSPVNVIDGGQYVATRTSTNSMDVTFIYADEK